MQIKKLHFYAVMFLIMVFLTGACNNEKRTLLKANHADSIIYELGTQLRYQEMLTLVDSLEMKGDLTPLNAYRWRGVSFYRQGHYRLAEIAYRRALESQIKSDLDQQSYNKAARRLTELLLAKSDYEGALSIAISTLRQMERTGIGSDIDYAILQNAIGCCLLNLGREGEAKEMFLKAIGHYENRYMADSTGHGYIETIIGMSSTSMAYINAHEYGEAVYWIDRMEKLMGEYLNKTDAPAKYVDEYQGRIQIMRAIALLGLGKDKEAAVAYKAFQETGYAKMAAGCINANDYLMAAQRYDEAADNYRYLDEMLNTLGAKSSLDNIQMFMLPKYRANEQAHRRDSARVTGQRILALLDSAITRYKESETAEMATIYDLNQKETQIAQQKEKMAHLRFVYIIIALITFVIFFVFYVLNRRKTQRHLTQANKRLEEGNARLKELNAQLVLANERAEESSKMKTNFIHQISHEIRTPLNILSGFTQVVTATDVELDEEKRADINKQIIENTNRITGLVNKMLELSDINSQKVITREDEVLVAEIALQAIGDSGVANNQHVTFELKLMPDAEAVMLHTDLKRATRALVLLLDNSMKFLGRPNEPVADGTVKLIVSVGLQGDVKQVLFTVEDSGIGVPAEEAEHIFEEFVQLDEYYDGTGIGLSVARSLARRLGGDIILDTSYSGGARFILSLPI